MLKIRAISHIPFKRLLSTSSSNVLEHLTNRSLLRVSGPDVSNFLQGLITNDIQHLSSGPRSIYAMFLNSAGRILYDSIIYRNLEENTYLVECDSAVVESLQKHLKLYRVRRKIDITNLTGELKMYALFNPSNIDHRTGVNFQNVDGAVIPCQKLKETQPTASFKAHQDLLIYRDPRLTDLGSRIIAKADVDVSEQLGVDKINKEKKYRWLRYNLGVGEGVQELPPGDSFPLECNGDYLHGVSFHKGCYVGQELTARIYHTGVIRKRLMPIYFSKTPTRIPEEKIVHENVNLGKLRGIEGNVGLALLRIAKVLAFKEFKIGDGIGSTFKPTWWPQEAPKEKLNVPQ